MNFKKNKIYILLKLLYRGFGGYKRRIVVLITLGFFSSLIGAIGINALIPLFSIVVNQSGNKDPITKTIVKLFHIFNLPLGVKYLLVFVCFLFVFKAILLIFSNYISSKIVADYEMETRSHLFKLILDTSWPHLLEQKLGYLETALMNNVRNCSSLLGFTGTIITLVVSLIVYAIIAINISFYITIITLVFSSLLIIIFNPIIHKTRAISYEEEKINRQIAHHINENILGMKTVKIMLAGNRIIKIARENFYKLRDIKIRSFLLSSLPGALMEPFGLIFICVVFAFSYKTSNFNIAALGAVVYLIKQIFAYAQQLQKYMLGVSSAVPYLRSILEYEEKAILTREVDRGSSEFIFNNSLEFKNIDFSYDHNKNVLKNMSFSIERGEMIGLIGHSGAGKTTIVDLFLRLFQPSKGKILIDDVNIEDISMEQWRRNIGYISQDMFLKNGTIAENIKFYDEKITDGDMEEAAKMANIYEFIQTLPDKFSTLIGERGVLLSAGQRQRIVIARVLAKKPKILVMDEATSALDNESEIQIQKIIENLKGKITVLVIAHRLSTVINSDRLLVLENGKIVEQGVPRELLKDKKTYFYKVYNIRK